MSEAEQRALFGCQETPALRQSLRAGPVSLVRQGARFGPICVHGHEVWHGVEFLLRDSGWGTPETVLDCEQLQMDAEGFVLHLKAHIPCSADDVYGHWDPQARLSLDVHVHGDAQGHLHFSVQATPSHELRVNRCGWVLMHSLSAAGSAVQVSHVDGRVTHSQFPKEVPAWPPFTNVKGVRHEYAPACWAQAELPGEDYEVEDQRNNADASFKTYSRSNWMPRPYVLHRHQSWQREMHLRLENVATANPVPPVFDIPPGGITEISQINDAGHMRLGLTITLPATLQPTSELLTLLMRWKPDFLHLTLWSFSDIKAVAWPQLRCMLDAAKAQLRIDLCVHDAAHHDWSADDEAAAQQLAQTMAQAGVVPSAVAAFPCGERAAACLRSLFPLASVGGGTPHFFAQLNRLERSGGEDFMAFTVCPIVHSAEDTTVMQGLQSLPSMLATARRRHPGRAWHLGPSGLGARASPLGRQPISDGSKRVPLASVDPRSRGLFGAAWLIGHMAGSAQAGVSAFTLPALISRPHEHINEPGTRWATPTEAMLEVCMSWQGIQSLELSVLKERIFPWFHWPFAAIVGAGPAGRQMLVANLTAQSQPLHWQAGCSWSRMDAQSWLQYEGFAEMSPWINGEAQAPFSLKPYAVALIDLPR